MRGSFKKDSSMDGKQLEWFAQITYSLSVVWFGIGIGLFAFLLLSCSMMAHESSVYQYPALIVFFCFALALPST